MAWLELLGDALREIRVHTLRSTLTLSGIVFGSASLVAMISLSGALKIMARDDFYSAGLPRSFMFFDRRPPTDLKRASERRFEGLRLTDLEALRQLPDVESVHGLIGSGPTLVTTSRTRATVPVQGVDAGSTELLEGETLRSRLRLGPLGWRKAVELAAQATPAAAGLRGLNQSQPRLVAAERARLKTQAPAGARRVR